MNREVRERLENSRRDSIYIKRGTLPNNLIFILLNLSWKTAVFATTGVIEKKGAAVS